VTPVVVLFERLPQVETLQLVRVQVTPAVVEPPVTAAVKLAESPGSIVSIAGPVIVIADGLLPPVRAGIARAIAVERDRALPRTRRNVGDCFPGKVRKAGLD
jgi:hypothetical protein